MGPGETPAASGVKLLQALDAITASAESPYALQIEPGTYDLGTTPLVMKPYVDLRGSGRDKTIITGVGSSSSFEQGATVIGARHVEARDLTIANTAGAAYATTFYFATDGSDPGAFVSFDDVALTADGQSSGSQSAYGAFLMNSQVVFTNTDISASFAGDAIGVHVEGAPAGLSLTRSTVTAFSSTGAPIGIWLQEGALSVTDSTVQGTNFGIFVGTGNFQVVGSKVLGTFGGIDASPGGSSPQSIDRSTVGSLINDGPTPFQVGASQLLGTASGAGGGGFDCAYVYSSTYAPLNADCH